MRHHLLRKASGSAYRVMDVLRLAGRALSREVGPALFQMAGVGHWRGPALAVAGNAAEINSPDTQECRHWLFQETLPPDLAGNPAKPVNHPSLSPTPTEGKPENNHAARRKSPAAILTEEEIAALVGPGAPEPEHGDRLLRVLLALVILFLGLTVAYLWHTRPVLQPEPETQASPEMSQARTAMAQGRHDQALRLLGVAAEKSGPGRLASINRFRAEVLLARAGRKIDSQPDLALSDITSAMGLTPDWPPGLLQAGRLLIRMDRLEGARDAYLRALAINPRLDVGWFNLGYIYLQTGRYDRAAEAFRRTIDLDSALAADAYVNLAICQTRLGRQPEAEASLRQALSLNPNHQTAREYLSKLTGPEPKK